jgi:hypothetical protein
VPRSLLLVDRLWLAARVHTARHLENVCVDKRLRVIAPLLWFTVAGEPGLGFLDRVDGIVGGTCGQFVRSVLDRAASLPPSGELVHLSTVRVVNGLPLDQRVQLIEVLDVVFELALPASLVSACIALN